MTALTPPKTVEAFSVETFSLELPHVTAPVGMSLTDALEAEMLKRLGTSAQSLLRWAIVRADTRSLFCEGAYLKANAES